MKVLMTLCVIFSLLGCKQNGDEKAIYGSWTTVKERTHSADEILDSIVFSKKRTANTYYVVGGKIGDSVNAKFHIDNNQLIIQYGDSTFTFDIIELNSQNLVTRQVDKKSSVTFYRLK
jgi:hypothetical protein